MRRRTSDGLAQTAGAMAASAAKSAADELSHEARRSVIRAALTAGAAAFGVIALGFLSAALWMLLDELIGPVVASLALAVLYAAVAAGLLAAAPGGWFGRGSEDAPSGARSPEQGAEDSSEPRSEAARAADAYASLLDAFSMGVEAGASAARSRRR